MENLIKMRESSDTSICVHLNFKELAFKVNIFQMTDYIFI